MQALEVTGALSLGILNVVGMLGVISSVCARTMYIVSAPLTGHVSCIIIRAQAQQSEEIIGGLSRRQKKRNHHRSAWVKPSGACKAEARVTQREDRVGAKGVR